MEATFKIWETSRNIYLKFFDNYSLEQLNTIPAGMSNNLIWNLGHVVVSQQKLVYALSGLPMHIPDSLFEKYQNGSRPDGKTTQAEVDEIKKLLSEMVEKTKADFEAGVFKEYHPYQTKTGFHLGTWKEAMEFNNYHEGIHLGIMMSIKKFL
ncbi:DinB family protein [Flavobacterium celericrescens]|uniref:DinB family protein n=1 Tax=Flavobacterium celericrescens TaxID=2709780 RepID=A0ABX0I8N0_9FLAO|nr:DinB family protein [Flavobacterium celericrescens]NHM03533.1 DinB family protein [Flavobacterium celericrescens]